MASKEWFARQLDSIGLTGLESVYDYLIELPEDEMLSYLASLIGSSPEAVAICQEFLEFRRREGADSNSTTVDAAHLSQPPTTLTHDRKTKRRGRGGGQARIPRLGSEGVDSSSATQRGSMRGKESNRRTASATETVAAKVREVHASGKPINCIKCGYIEFCLGSEGKCSFCGSSMFIMNEGESGAGDDGFAAEEQKNRLLSFDQSSSRRTRVLDDDSEYFDADSDNWLTEDERQRIREERAAKDERQRRKSFNVTIDLAGRRILDDSGVGRASNGGLSKDLDDPVEGGQARSAADTSDISATDGTGFFANPLLHGPGPRFMLDNDAIGNSWLAVCAACDAPPVRGRVQREDESI